MGCGEMEVLRLGWEKICLFAGGVEMMTLSRRWGTKCGLQLGFKDTGLLQLNVIITTTTTTMSPVLSL